LTHRVFWQIATGMTPANLGRTLALSLFLGLGCGGISFAEQPTEHWLIGLWQEKDSGAVVMISGVEPDGTALGTIGPTEAVQVKTETKVDGPRVRIVSESGTVIEAARTPGGDLSGTLTVLAGTRWSVTFVKWQRCQDDPVPASGQSYGPPKYCVGDTWRFTTGRVQTVVRVDADSVAMTGYPLLPGPCPGCIYEFDRNQTFRSIRQPGGNSLDPRTRWMPFGEGWQLWDFPFTVGKTWRISVRAFVANQARRVTLDCSVEGYEDVKTKAGTFKAFKISRTWKSEHSGDRGTESRDISWFAPGVKTIVKQELLSSGMSWELVSYDLKKFMAPPRQP